MKVLNLARTLFAWLPGSPAVKARLRMMVLRYVCPEHLRTSQRAANAPYRGDPADPRLREQARTAWEDQAERELDQFLSSRQRMRFPQTTAECPSLSVLVVVYNAPGLTFRCLRALAGDLRKDVEVVLVNNDSNSRTNMLLERVDGVTHVRNDTNLHYIEAVNQARHLLHGDYVLLLNNDVQVEPGALHHTLQTMASDESIGAVGPQVLSIDGLLLEAGCEIAADGTCSPLLRGESPVDTESPYAVREVDYVSGCFLLTRRSLFESLEGLDRRYAPAYYDDADYCTELWQRGYRVVVDTRARVVHFESAGSGNVEIATLMQRNRRRFRHKHHWRHQHQARQRCSTVD